MLLGNELLIPDEERAARVWLVRERTEHEAAAAFRALSGDLASSGAPRALVVLASQCAEDELVHAAHCRAIVESLAPGAPPLRFDAHPMLGLRGESASRRALYASVALGCVTETLSTALLLEIRRAAEHPVVRSALDVILEDEVRHSRLGWAHLAYAAEREDVRWIAEHTPAMLREAIDTEGSEDGPGTTLVRFGILDRNAVARICAATIADTIVPGLARYGIELRGHG